MQQLTDSILLYHGSYMTVSNIELSKCKIGLDFGHGFYVTSSYQQARDYIPSAVRKAIATKKKSTDIIGGKVADDNTARTLTFYTQGDATLEFVRSERYGDIK